MEFGLCYFNFYLLHLNLFLNFFLNHHFEITPSKNATTLLATTLKLLLLKNATTFLATTLKLLLQRMPPLWNYSFKECHHFFSHYFEITPSKNATTILATTLKSLLQRMPPLFLPLFWNYSFKECHHCFSHHFEITPFKESHFLATTLKLLFQRMDFEHILLFILYFLLSPLYPWLWSLTWENI